MITPPPRTVLGNSSSTGFSLARGPGALVCLLAGVLLCAACGDPNDPQAFGSLSGEVRTGGDFGPLLAGARITVAGREGESGSDGRFEIDSIPAGIQPVTTTLAGFVTQSFDAEIRAGIVNLYDVELTPVDEPGPPTLRITTSALPVATVDVPYSVSLEATGGTPPYTWGGSPPPGLAITGEGVLSGTPGFPAGEYTVRVTVRDASATLASVDLPLEVRTESGLRALPEELSTGEAGVPYADTVHAEGGAPPYTFQLDGLPGGLELDPATGVISGVPTGATGREAEPIGLELIVRDVVGASAFDSVSIGIAPAPLAITSDLPDGQVGVFYEVSLERTGGFGTFATYTVIAGDFPPGLSISGPESLLGPRVSGTPTLAGTYEFTLQLSLCESNLPSECVPQIATRDYVVVISGSQLSIVTSSLPDAAVGIPYSVFLVREGGTAPFQWDVISGSLPPGISLTAAGELTGTPTAAGDATFEVRVQDAGNQSASASLTLHVEP